MAFRDFIAYLVIKIWIKSKLPKIVLQEKIGLVKNENRKGSISTKKSLKGEAQNSVQQPKGIGPVCNPVTACSLALLRLIISPSFQLRIAIRLKH